MPFHLHTILFMKAFDSWNDHLWVIFPKEDTAWWPCYEDTAWLPCYDDTSGCYDRKIQNGCYDRKIRHGGHVMKIQHGWQVMMIQHSGQVMKIQHGIWQRLWQLAPYRTPPRQSLLPAWDCHQHYKMKEILNKMTISLF